MAQAQMSGCCICSHSLGVLLISFEPVKVNHRHLSPLSITKIPIFSAKVYYSLS